MPCIPVSPQCLLWSPEPHRHVQAPLPVGDGGSRSDAARGGAKRRVAREPPRRFAKANRVDRGAKHRMMRNKENEKRFFLVGHHRVALGHRLRCVDPASSFPLTGSQWVRVKYEVTINGAWRIPVAMYPRITPMCAMVTRAAPACPSTATSWGWREQER